MKSIKIRLSILNFLEFAVWGAYLTSLGTYLSRVGLGTDIGWFYAVQGIVSIFMPGIVGIIADRYIQGQKMLSICHTLAGAFMIGAGWYAYDAGSAVQFGPLFTLYTLSVAFFMPTIGLANSVCYNALTKAGLDTVKHFPPIRVFGTIGFIVSMNVTNFAGFQFTCQQMLMSGVISFALAVYSLSMPACPVHREAGKASLSEALGLRAFSLFKDHKMAIFFIFSMLLGVSLQITNGYANPFISSFVDIPEFASDWAARNANTLISISQVSETICILFIPFFLKRYGIKIVMLMAMFAWVFRFGFFGIGDTGWPGVLWLILSCIVYGVAFDFFNVSGSLYVDQQTPVELRSSAQGLFMIMTNGIGATVGTLVAQEIINDKVFSQPVGTAQMQGWHESWFIFAGYALVVAVLFWLVFRHPHKRPENTQIKAAEKVADDAI